VVSGWWGTHSAHRCVFAYILQRTLFVIIITIITIITIVTIITIIIIINKLERNQIFKKKKNEFEIKSFSRNHMKLIYVVYEFIIKIIFKQVSKAIIQN
jgi:hypothetical protein